MRQQLIIEKIKKLMALANSNNEHEAALATSHVQRLLSEHNLAMADIDSSNKPDKANTLGTKVSKTLPKWLRNLVAGVSSAFDCQAVHDHATGKMLFIGVGADVHIAVYTFTYLERTLRKLCVNYMKGFNTCRQLNRQRELLRQSYYLGAVATIVSRLQEQKIQTPVTSTALVPIKESLIKQAMNEMGDIRAMHSRRSSVNSNAYNMGKIDGESVGLNQGITTKSTTSFFLEELKR